MKKKFLARKIEEFTKLIKTLRKKAGNHQDAQATALLQTMESDVQAVVGLDQERQQLKTELKTKKKELQGKVKKLEKSRKKMKKTLKSGKKTSKAVKPASKPEKTVRSAGKKA